MRLDPHHPAVFTYYLGLAQLALKRPEALDTFSIIRVARGGVPVARQTVYGKLYRMSTSLPIDLALRGLMLVNAPHNCRVVFEQDVWLGRRFDGRELRALLLGHRAHGRSFETGEEHAWSVAADGRATLSGGWGDRRGLLQIQDGKACFEWSDGTTACGDIFRNPGGSKAKGNEYFWHQNSREGICAFAFSNVE